MVKHLGSPASLPAIAGLLVALATACLALLSSHVLAAPANLRVNDDAPHGLYDVRAADGPQQDGREAPALQRSAPTPVVPFARAQSARADWHRRQTSIATTSTTQGVPPTNPAAPFDPNARPTTALSVFLEQTQTDSNSRTEPDAQSAQSRGQPALGPAPQAPLLRRQTTLVTTPTSTGTALPTTTSSGGGGGFPGNTLLNGANLPAPFLAFAVAAIALFVLVVAFVLLRIFVRNRRLRRLGLLPGDLAGSRMLVPTREIEDTLAPPKLWEAKIADLEEVQKLKATRSTHNEKAHDWDGIMPIAAALPTQLYVSLVPDGGKVGDVIKADGPSGQSVNAQNGEAQRRSVRRGLERLLRKSGTETGAAPHDTTSDPPSRSQAGPSTGVGTADDAANSAQNDVPMPAAVNVTVLIAMPSPKTVVPSRKQPKPKKSMVSFVSGASASKPSLIPAQLSTTKVDETDEEYMLDAQKGKTKREPSLRSVRTAHSATSFAEARREAFFRSEEAAAEEAEPAGLPTADQRSEYGYDNGDDEEEELPELMFGTASVPVYRDWNTTSTQTGTAASAPIPEDLVFPTRGDLLRLLLAARQVKERKALDAVAQQKAAARKGLAEEGGVAGLDGVRTATGLEGEMAAATSTDFPPAGRRSSLTTTEMQLEDVTTTNGESATAAPSGSGPQGPQASQAGLGAALAGVVERNAGSATYDEVGSVDDRERRRGSWLSREGHGYASFGYMSTSQANLAAGSIHTEDALLRDGGAGGGESSPPTASVHQHPILQVRGLNRLSNGGGDASSNQAGGSTTAASQRGSGLAAEPTTATSTMDSYADDVLVQGEAAPSQGHRSMHSARSSVFHSADDLTEALEMASEGQADGRTTTTTTTRHPLA